MNKLLTIGVYGFEEAAFFRALQEAGVDTFCDIRRRRGVRGATYAFANSKRLQARLAEMGIRYLHCLELAPTDAVRHIQYEVDEKEKVAKRKRQTLSPAFIAAFEEQILCDFDARAWLDNLPPDAKVVVLFCVETEPAACHRSLIAGRIEQELAVPVEHIMP